MKYILVLAFLFVGFNANAFLTETQESQVLQVIDDVCADSWCEGSFNIEFESIRCSYKNNVCIIKMNFIDSVEEASPLGRTCVIENVGHINELIRPSEQDLSLTTKLSAGITACVDKVYAEHK